MDRDIALQITQKITAINTALQTLVTNTAPTADSRSISPDPAEQQRSAPEEPEEPEVREEEPEVREEEPEAPAEEPKTRTKK